MAGNMSSTNMPCKHPNLKEYYEEKKVFEINSAGRREIVRIIQVKYFHCGDCEKAFITESKDNEISKN